MLWDNTFAYRLNRDGHVDQQSGGTWRVGQLTDPADGETYDVVHWQDIDDNSWTFYFQGQTIVQRYYEN